jgi:hypothetical protein
MGNSYLDTSVVCPDTPDIGVRTFRTRTGQSGYNMKFHRKVVFSGRFDCDGFCRFS